MSKFMIIDGNSMLNRAYYAIRSLSTKSGQPTNAIYGFLNIMNKYTESEKPDGVCVSFDLKGKTFRHKFYSEYKAQRKGMPDDLASQLEPTKKILRLLGIPIYEIEGFEADDVIGTFSQLCEKTDNECVILTGDKDDLQLAGKNTSIRLIRTVGGKTQDELFDEQRVFDEYGLTPLQFIDLKAVMGDKSDNIPGVPGIGEKGAAELMHEFGSLDAIYENIDSDKIKPGVRNKLIEGRQSAFDSRFLSEINRNVPIEFDLDGILSPKRDSEGLIEYLKELELNSFIAKLELKESTLEKEISHISDISLIYGKPCAYYFEGDKLFASNGEGLYEITEIPKFLEDENIPKITFDVKHDIVSGHKINNVIFDVSLGAYVCDQSVAPVTAEKVFTRYGGLFENPADRLFNAYKELSALILELGLSELYYDMEFPLAYVLADMQLTGVHVDKDVLSSLSEEYNGVITGLERDIYEIAGCEFNINSTKQLGDVLYNKLMLPMYKKNKRGASTDAETLEKLEPFSPIIRKILDYRQFSKLKSTYIEGVKPLIRDDGRLHTNYNQCATQTGRLSSTEPNLQNIPVRTEEGKRIRKMFTPREGCAFLDADYSQIELRVLAHMSGDENMISAFLSGEDIHTETAAYMFGVDKEDVTPEMRSRAKAVNFGIVYGIGDFTLSKNLGVTRAEAKRYMESYKERYPKIGEFMEKTVENAKKNGYVETWFKRRRYIPELSASNFVTRSFGERAAMNAPVQGTAADIIKFAMINVYNRLKDKKSKLIMQIHDELVLEVPLCELSSVTEILRSEMENVVDFSVPLTVDIHSGASLYETK